MNIRYLIIPKNNLIINFNDINEKLRYNTKYLKLKIRCKQLLIYYHLKIRPHSYTSLMKF